MGFGFVPSNLRLRQRQQPQQQSPNPLAILQFRQQQQEKQRQEAADRENEALRSIRKNADQALAQGLEFVRLNPEGNIKNMLPMLRDNGLTFAAEQSLIEAASAVKKRTQDAAKKAELAAEKAARLPQEVAAGKAIGELGARQSAQPPVGGPLSLDELAQRISFAKGPGELAQIAGAAQGRANMAGENQAETRAIRTEQRAARRKFTDAVREREETARQNLTELHEFETSVQVSADAAGVKFRPEARRRLARADKAGTKIISDPVLGLPLKGGDTLLADLHLKSDVVGMLQDLEDAANAFAETGKASGFTGSAEEFRRQFLDSADPLFAKYDAIKSVQVAIEAKSRSGATMTKAEIDMIDRVFPAVNNLRFVNGRLTQAARNRLDVFTKSVIGSYANRLSGTYTPGSLRKALRETAFGSNDPVALDATPVPAGEGSR